MDQTRASQLAHLRFQIRALRQRERSLVFLNNKTCIGNHAETEKELILVRRHVQEAEDNLTAFLQARSAPVAVE